MRNTNSKKLLPSRYWLFTIQGQSTLEILISLAIFAMAISAIIAVSYGNQSVSVDTENSHQALQLAEEALETVKANAKDNFSSAQNSTSTSGIFTKEIIVQDVSSTEKNVTIRVTWRTDPIRTQKQELVTILTDPTSLLSNGGDPGCGNNFAGSWANPVAVGSLDLGAGITSTGLDVLNRTVYMSGTASSASKDDFFVVDASVPPLPTIISRLEVGSTGINAIDATTNYVYAANNNTSDQLLVIDISNRNSPTIVARLTLFGTLGSGAVGNSIFYYNNKVYIGTKSEIGPEFHIVDVSTPTAPVELGSFKVGGDVNAIKVDSGKAYIATSLDNAELKILNVSNPAAIIALGGYDAHGNNDGASLYLNGNTLYLGRAKGENEYSILDVSNPSIVRLIGEEDINAGINSLLARSDLSLLATDDTTKEFQVWDTSDPSNIRLRSSLNLPNVGIGLDCENGVVYLGLRSNDALRIITPQ